MVFHRSRVGRRANRVELALRAAIDRHLELERGELAERVDHPDPVHGRRRQVGEHERAVGLDGLGLGGCERRDLLIKKIQLPDSMSSLGSIFIYPLVGTFVTSGAQLVQS